MDFLEDFLTQGEACGPYLYDLSFAQELIARYDTRDPTRPLFLYGLSMENHQPYNPEKYGVSSGFPAQSDLLSQEDLAILDSLVVGLHHADQALGILTDYFSQVEEPTLILLFGDHQPQVATNFYTDVLGTAPDTALAQKKQMVPFVLWANYDIPEAQGVELSLNYLSALLMDTANLPMTGYQKYLARLWEAAPVINTVGIRDAGGNWYGENEALPEELEAAVEESFGLSADWLRRENPTYRPDEAGYHPAGAAGNPRRTAIDLLSVQEEDGLLTLTFTLEGAAGQPLQTKALTVRTDTPSPRYQSLLTLN